MRLLYNNISLPDKPPTYAETTLDKPLDMPPWLKKKPAFADIRIGRQLFVDDFLVETTDLLRIFRHPVITEKPVFEPQTALEMNDGYCPCACPFNDGIFYDDESRKFKMWYHAGWFDGVGYAESDDGIYWKRLPEINPHFETERVIPHVPGMMRDGSAVWIDCETDKKDERYKMLVFYRQYDHEVKYYHQKPKHRHDVPGSVPPVEKTLLFKSSNGIKWENIGETGRCGDNSTFFYNPFTKKWIFSLRTFSKLDSRIRTRGYFETDNFFGGSMWNEKDVRFWSRSDIYDQPDENMGYYTQLYGLDATPYESLMLGVFSIFMGPPNSVCEITKMPKINDLKLAYSRDGFHWTRPTYENFLASSRIKGTWNYGYLHPANGICTIVGDEIYFYFSCFSGVSPQFATHKYAGGNLGLARLRRDGFVALSDCGRKGFVVTEKLKFSGTRLFVNCDCPQGSLTAEILDENSKVIEGFSAQNCRPFSGNKTCVPIEWHNYDLKSLENRLIKIRFNLSNAELYSFWIADDESGHSRGYMAAGGPGFYKRQDIRDPRHRL